MSQLPSAFPRENNQKFEKLKKKKTKKPKQPPHKIKISGKIMKNSLENNVFAYNFENIFIWKLRINT